MVDVACTDACIYYDRQAVVLGSATAVRREWTKALSSPVGVGVVLAPADPSFNWKPMDARRHVGLGIVWLCCATPNGRPEANSEGSQELQALET